MLLYEIWKKTEERKYLVVAVDTQEARDIVIEHLNNQSDELIERKDLGASYADIQQSKKRNVVTKVIYGFAYHVTAWDLYKECRDRGQAKIITNYLY